MKFHSWLSSLILMTLFASVAMIAQEEEMSKDQWQSEINAATTQRNELKARLDQLSADIENLKKQSTQLDADIAACEDEMYGMLGVTRAQVEAFERELRGYEQRVDELMKMSDADLLGYRDEIAKMSKRVDEMMKDKIATIPSLRDRLSALRNNINALMATLAKAGMASVYVVGTWARDRDCLWNIAKKPNIYNNAWLWPKIWQGNKDKIRDPDIIQPGWQLNIPSGSEMTREEKAAANSYYRKKAGQ